jgi:hypothetical protein
MPFKEIIAIYSENHTKLFVMVKCCVLFAVRTEFLNIIKTRLCFKGLTNYCYSDQSQKIAVFILTAVKTSNPTKSKSVLKFVVLVAHPVSIRFSSCYIISNVKLSNASYRNTLYAGPSLSLIFPLSVLPKHEFLYIYSWRYETVLKDS